MSSAPPDSSTATPDYHRPRVLHVPAEKGVVKWMSGDVYETMATADSTNGALGFTVCWVPPGGGPIAHVHKSADESFYLISGSLEFLNGDQTFMANAGDFVFVPRGTRHRFRNLTDAQAHMVSFFTPGGGEALWLEGGDDPVPGAKPEFWPPERGLALGPLLVRTDIDMEILPEEADFDGPADEA
ncbi:MULTISPECIES: cupin domain-containing protein [Streptomyces]|uniref:cupin domain-containing protein n=1 Tax=Streptomyces TaxID=1883 RepID=UPI001161FA0A|nr:cupin domain-containing protein [Streptomyces sp. S1A1-7]QDN79332.1 cupin domain-containing protein [Streptomyces sp. S1A1-7]